MRFVILLALLAGTAGADVYKSKAGQVSIEIPKKWQVTATDEIIRTASPNNEIALVLWVVESADVKTGLTKLEGELYSFIQGLKWVDKTKKLKINKLPATFVEGVGVSGQAKQLDVLVTIAGPTGTKKGVIVMAAVEHDKLAANKTAIQSIVNTLRPIAAERAKPPSPAKTPAKTPTPTK